MLKIKEIRKKMIASLTIMMLLFNFITPYSSIFSSKVSATEISDLTPPKVIFRRTTGIQQKTNGRIFQAEIGVVGDMYVWGVDVKFTYDSSKIVPGRSNGAEPTSMAQFSPIDSNWGRSTAVDKIDTTACTFRLQATSGGTALNPKLYMEDEGLEEEPEYTEYNGYMKIYTLYFKVVDDSMTDDNIPTNLFEFCPITGSLPTGFAYGFSHDDTESGECLWADNINLLGGDLAPAQNAKTISSIAVKTNPSNTTYEHGDTIDLTGGVITVTYDDGTTEDVDMTDSGVSITSPTGGSADVSTPTVTISYGGQTATFNTTVTDPVTALDTVGGMSTTTYNHGDTISFSSLSLQATRKSGATVALNLTDNGVTTSETTASVNSSNFTQNGTTSGGLVTGQQKIKFTYTEPGTSNTVSTTSSGTDTEASIIVNDTVTAVSVISQPTKQTYKRGESLSLSGAKVQLTLASGNTPIEVNLPDASVTVGTYSPTTTGSKQNLSVAYGSVTSSDTIDVEAYNYITNSTLTPPSDVNPEYNTNLNLAGGKFDFTWQDGTTSSVNLTDTSVAISGYNSTTLTAQTVTATYTTNYTLSDGTKIPETITKTFTVQVDDKVDTIAITAPTKTTYNHGDSLDVSDGTITVTTKSGATTDVPMDTSMITENGGTVNMSPAVSDYTNNSVSKTLKISYTEDGVTQTVNYPITINNNVTGIAMGTTPTKTTYNINDTTYDLTNTAGTNGYGDIIVTRAAGNTETVALNATGVTLTNLSTLTTSGGSKTVTVSYEGQTTSFNITVVNGVTGIVITAPTKTDFEHGDSLDLTGGTITVTYADGTTSTPTMTSAMITETTSGSSVNMSPADSEYNNNNEVTKNLTITYTEDGQTKTETYNIKITNPVDTIAIATSPTTSYNLNDSTANAGGTLTVTRKSGKTETVNIADSMITGLDTTTAGASKTATVTYEGKTTTYSYAVIDNVASIAITAPTDTNFNHGDALTVNGGIITVTYASGTTATPAMTTAMITEKATGTAVNMSPAVSDYINNKVTKTLTITYTENGVTKTQDYTITINNNVTGIAMGTTPTKTTYNINDTTYDLTNTAGTNGYGDIIVTRAAGNTETVALNATGVTLTNLSTLTTSGGSKTVTVSYEGQTTSFNITVVNGVTGIVITAPTKTDFEHGDSLDLTGGTITVTYADGTTSTPTMTSAMITETTSGSSVNMSPADSEYNNNNEVTKNLTITYTEDGQTKTETYNIKITNPVDTIAIATSPTTSYNLNDSTANAGGTLTVTRKSGKTETVNIADSMITGLDTTTAGASKTATVTYEGKTTTYSYAVIDNVASIAITAPTDTNFNHGDALTVNGGIITVTYASGTTATPAMTTAMITEKATGTAVNMSPAVSDYINNKVTKTLTITYTENGVTKTQDYTITINNNVTGIAMGTTPTKTTYNINDTTYDLTNTAGTNGYGDIIVTRAAGNTETVALNATGVTLTNLSTLTTSGGSKTVTVSYEGQTTSFNITVVNGVTGIVITAPTKTDFEHGDSLDLTGGTITVTYADGTTSTPTMTSAMITETTSGSSVNMSPADSEYNNNNEVTKNLTITYTEDGQTKTETYNIKITNPVDTIAIATSPTTSYNLNDSTANAGGTLTVTRKSGKTETVNITDSMITGLDTTTAGASKTATVTYEGKTTTYSYAVIDNVASIAITAPTDTNFNHGDALTVNGGIITVTYASGTTATPAMTTAMITEKTTGTAVNMSPAVSDYINNKVTKTLTITYTENGVTKTQDYTITINNNVTGIAMGTTPTKTTYNINDTTYDLTNTAGTNGYGDIIVTRAAGNTETVALNATGVTLTNLSTLTTSGGSKTVTVSYEGQTTSFNITVVNGVTGIVITAPTKTDFEHGDSLDLTGGKIEVTYADGTKQTPTMTTAMITETTSGLSVNMTPNVSEYSNNSLTKNLTITYIEGTQTKTINYNITIYNSVDHISMNQTPKDSYKYGETTDITAGTIDVYRKANPTVVSDTINLTDSAVTVTGLDTTTAGTGKTATVTYEETYGTLGKVQKTTTYNYSVSDKVTGMIISGTPKTDYEYGDTIDLSGITISITTESNSTGTPITLPNSHIKVDGFDTTSEGTKTVTLKYLDDNGDPVNDLNGDPIEYQFTINVTDPITSIAMDSSAMPKQNYLVGEALDVTSGKIIVTKKSGTTFTQSLTSNMISGFDSSSVATGKKLTVTLLDSNNDPILDSNKKPITTSYTINVTDPVKSITINPGPTKTTYQYGDPIDLTGAYIDILKENGNTDRKAIDSSMISGYNPTPAAGTLPDTQTITVTEGVDKNGNPVTSTFTVTVEDYIKEIKVNGAKTEYKWNEDLDLSTGTIEITMASGTPTTDVKLDDSSVQVSGYNKTNPSSQTLTVTYEGKTTTYTVNVKDYVIGRTIVAPTKDTYNYGDNLELSTGKIVETWASGKPDTYIPLTPNMVTEADGSPLNMKPTNYDSTNKISKTLKITYTADNNTITKDYPITIINDVKGVAIKTTPKTEYNYGDTIDKTIGSIEVTRADGSKEKVSLTDSRVNITGFDTSTESKNVPVTIKFTENGITKDTTYLINVKDNVLSITLVGTPKTTYKYGENLNLSNLQINVVRQSDAPTGTNMPVTQSMISGYNPQVLGKQTVTVTYGTDTNGKPVTTTFDVKVEDYIKDISIDKPKKLVYKIGETIDLTGGYVNLTMASGTATSPIAMTNADVKIEGFDTSSEGAKLIKVTYKGHTKTFGITVVDPLSDMVIKTLPDKLDYRYGEDLDVTGGTIEIIKESGASQTINITKDMVTGYNPKKLGNQTLTVTYKGLTQQFIVNVEDYISKLEVKKPQKVDYEYGESLDLTGGKVSIIMASGAVKETAEMTNSMLSGYDRTKEGTQTIKVEYKGLQGNFQVSVVDKIKGITLNSEPNKINYKYGENIDVTGATINVIKSSGIYTIPVTRDMISGYNPQNSGIQSITVTYKGFTAKFMVLVAEQEKVTEPEHEETKTNTNNLNRKPIVINNNIEESAEVQEPITEEKVETPTQPENTKPENNVKPQENKPTETLGVKDEKEPVKNNKDIAGVVCIAGLLLLLILILFRRNVKVYVEEEGEFVLGGLDKITKKQPELNIDKYLDGENYNNKVKIHLSDSISEKLDGKEIEIKHRGQKIKYKIIYDDEPYEIILE